MTALHVASENGHVEVVNILLWSGAHVDVQEEVSWRFLHSTDRAVKHMYHKNTTMTDVFIRPIVLRTSGLL